MLFTELEILRRSSIFSPFSLNLLKRKILPLGVRKVWKKGQQLIRPREQVNQLSVILSGKVNILQIFSDGTDTLMGTMKPSSVLGLDLISTKTRISPYYAVAVKDTLVLSFEIDQIIDNKVMTKDTQIEFWRQMSMVVSQENMRKHYHLTILSQRGLRSRILTYLTMQANRRNQRTFDIPFSREELALFLCVNRSALSHELALMKQEGLLDFRKNSFTLLETGVKLSPWD